MSNDMREDLKNMSADLALEMAIEMGEEFTYYHQGTPITVYGFPGEETFVDESNEDIVGQTITKPFTIPMQTSFPPDNDPQKIRRGDYIQYQNERWYVDNGRRGSLQANFVVSCLNSQEHIIK
jgi:hypothetical protein